MTSYTAILLPVLFIAMRLTLGIQHFNDEVTAIFKRMAEEGEAFEDSDVARVHFVQGQGQGQTKKRLTKRDLSSFNDITTDDENNRALHLDLSSGSKVKLALKRSGIVGPDTLFSIQNGDGSIIEKRGAVDCFSHGQVEDSSGEGWAAISHCDGLFGFASSPGYEYFLHPLEGGDRTKREASAEFDVHVMWRQINSTPTDDPTDSIRESVTDYLVPRNNQVARRLGGSDEDRINNTGFVIELAMFSDEKYWQIIHNMFPGRENDVLLTRLVGAQALYSNRDQIGYDVQIKVKLLEHWKTNPEGYTFNERLASNLKSFCKYTKSKYFYDVHLLNTGVTHWNQGQVGLAYVGGACSRKRCMVAKSVHLKSFFLYAHELGHTLGMTHNKVAKCPAELKAIGGFMGGEATYNFSPCMKEQLDAFLNTSKSNCLFKETAESTMPIEFNELEEVLPGQYKSPDDLCQMLSGSDYSYVPLWKSLGKPVCHWMVCHNGNASSPEFGRVQRLNAPPGFPCKKNSMCMRNRSCEAWNTITMVLKVEDLQKQKRIPQWSEWATDFSECSRTCGTGVRTRRRECLYSGYSLAPYCPGMAVQAQLCNTDRCPGDPKGPIRLRRHRSNQVCEGFKNNNVQLDLGKATGYLPQATGVTNRDAGAKVNMIQSKSCILMCKRMPNTAAGDVDAFIPDGTPCFDKTITNSYLKRNNIKLRCLTGFCLKFSDCPNALDSKDSCGVCNGDGSRCVDLQFDAAYDVPTGQHSNLTIIPAGATNIHANLRWKDNRGVILELWSLDGVKVIGRRGVYPKNVYIKAKEVDFAGTRWSYKRRHAYLKAPGPLEEAVMIRAYRQRYPITDIQVKYANPADVTLQA